MDLFGNMSDPKVSKKFQIYRFTNGSRSNKSPLQEGRAGTKADDALLERSIKEIESSSAKLLMEYDRIYKEMMVKRKQLNQEAAEMKGVAKGEVLAMFHKADIDLLNSAVRVIDSKASAISNKIKALRDERKFYIDKTKPVATQDTANNGGNVNTTGVGFNSPLVVVNSDRTPPTSGNAHVVSRTVPRPAEEIIDVNKIDFTEHKEETALPLSPMEKYESLQKEAVEIGNASENQPIETPLNEPVRSVDNTIVSMDATGTVAKTVDDIQKENLDKINARLALGNEFKSDYHTRLGHDYNRSIKAMKQADARVEHHMYIDPDSGMYYMKGFTRDENNNLVEYEDYDPMGLPHIGTIKFNGSKPECKIQFSQDAIPYHVVNGISDMSDFYKTEWSKPSANQFVIDNESDIMTIKKVGSNQ